MIRQVTSPPTRVEKKKDETRKERENNETIRISDFMPVCVFGQQWQQKGDKILFTVDGERKRESEREK